MSKISTFWKVVIVIAIIAIVIIAIYALRTPTSQDQNNPNPTPSTNPDIASNNGFLDAISGFVGSLFKGGSGNNANQNTGGCSWWQKLFGGCGGNNFGLPDCDPNHIGYTKDGTYDARCTSNNGNGCIQGKPSADDPCVDECGFSIPSSDAHPECGGRIMGKKIWRVISVQTTSNPNNKILTGITFIPNNFQIGNTISISLNNGITTTGKIIDINSNGMSMTVSFPGIVSQLSNGQISEI